MHYMSFGEMSKKLGVSRNTVRAWAYEGKVIDGNKILKVRPHRGNRPNMKEEVCLVEAFQRKVDVSQLEPSQALAVVQVLSEDWVVSAVDPKAYSKRVGELLTRVNAAL